jgi:aspartyl-tRNA(Asn)/glutamyl-tRNA(Gln) amidotransferase subunit A
MAARWTLAELARDLGAGKTTARELVDTALTRIADPDLQGRAAFISVNGDAARTAAVEIDRLRRAGRAPSPYAGIPLAVKDLFDLEGEVTTAGSVVLRGEPPAGCDAPAIAALRTQGFIVIGRTNMTEFAYSGVGLNPHYGTPLSAYDRATGRIPGGSSSGAAVSIADGMAALAIGSDTGGSCRIPAAYNGIVGYKPSARRISTEGVFPLSASFDSIGPLANSVACCAAADAIMAGDWDGVIAPREASSITLGVLTTTALDGLDTEVAADFERSIALLSKAGVNFVDAAFPELLELPQLTAKGGIVAYEAYAHHKDRLAAHGPAYDPRVGTRLQMAAEMGEADYRAMCKRRGEIIAAFTARMEGLSGLALPAVMNIPPRLHDFATDAEYIRLNGKSLRNTYIGNFLDACAIAVPMHLPGAPPTGFMVMDSWGRDQNLFPIAQSIEVALHNY